MSSDRKCPNCQSPDIAATAPSSARGTDFWDSAVCNNCGYPDFEQAPARHSSLGLYFPLSQDAANALRSRLNAVAASHGYVASRGPTVGQGNLAALLIAIDSGEVATVLLDDDEVLDALNALESIDESWAHSIALALRAAQARQAEADSDEMSD